MDRKSIFARVLFLVVALSAPNLAGQQDSVGRGDRDGPRRQPGGRGADGPAEQVWRERAREMPERRMARPMYLSGKVVTEDGSPIPESVLVELVCQWDGAAAGAVFLWGAVQLRPEPSAERRVPGRQRRQQRRQQREPLYPDSGRRVFGRGIAVGPVRVRSEGQSSRLRFGPDHSGTPESARPPRHRHHRAETPRGRRRNHRELHRPLCAQEGQEGVRQGRKGTAQRKNESWTRSGRSWRRRSRPIPSTPPPGISWVMVRMDSPGPGGGAASLRSLHRGG